MRKKKVFFIVSRFPFPIEKGDKLRAFNQLKELSKYFEVDLCVLTYTRVNKKFYKQVEDYCQNISIIRISWLSILLNLLFNFFNSKCPLQISFFYTPSKHKKVTDLIKKSNPDLIYCQLIRVSEYVRHYPIPKILDFMDAFSKGMEQRTYLKRSLIFLFSYLYKMESIKLKRYENSIVDDFDAVTIISEQDRGYIPHINNHKILVVPNGIDLKKYKYSERKKEIELLFTGNMSYTPNVESVIFMIDEILPIVHKKYPELKLYIVGANPSVRIKRKMSKKVIVTGRVEEIISYYQKAKVFVAPMQIGTGLQNKILEAMALKLPCVVSELANKPVKAIPEESVLIANSPEEYANQIFRLLENNALCDKLAENGYLHMKKKYNWQKNTQKLIDLINSYV